MSKRQAALAVVRLEDGVEDVEDGLVLEHAAVAAQREECSPRFVREAVAREAAVRTQQFGRGDVAVERARCRKGGGLEFEQHALSPQRLQRDVGVQRQCGHRPAISPANPEIAASNMPVIPVTSEC